MGWGRTILLGDIGTQMNVDDAVDEIRALRHEVTRRRAEGATREDRLTELARENDELKLYVAVLVRLLVAKNIATPEEIRKMIDAVDCEDGKFDHNFKG